MNRKHLVLLSFLAIFLSSCSIDSEETGLTDWLSDQGMPSNYKVQMVTVKDLYPLSAEVYQDSAPKSGRGALVFGAASNLSHDIVLDFGLDSSIVSKLSKADSSVSKLFLYLLDSFYDDKDFPSDSLPIKEKMNVKVSWKLSKSMTRKVQESLVDISDSSWLESVKKWKPDASADTTFDIAVFGKDTLAAEISLPSALIDSICTDIGYRRLQLRLSAPEASHLYRFYGSDVGVDYAPIYRAVAFKKGEGSFVSHYPIRAANIYSNKETCSDCLVLHGGVFDSLVVEYPSAPIMKALSEFYGDEFPYNKGDKNDVRQAVVMAQITYERDDSNGSTELGLPIRVEVASFLDSADEKIRSSEYYKLTDKDSIAANGHQNLVFHEGNTFSLQVTNGMREFINKASDGRAFKMMMSLGRSVLGEKDSVFVNNRIEVRMDTINGKPKEVRDTVRVYFPLPDYARYDMTQSMMKKPATLKLWLASKRGNE